MTYPNTDVQIIAICGSLRPISYTRMALTIALQGAQQTGVSTQMIDLRDYQLIFCDGRDRDDYPPDVIRLRNQVSQAQGIILGTPEYHGGYSGVLKNALDLMSFREMQGKMVGLVGVGGGRLGATTSLNSLRTVGRWLRAWVIPEQVSIPNSSSQFDEHGQLHNPNLETRLLELGRQVARFAYLHHATEAREFLQLWEQAQPNPGGD